MKGLDVAVTVLLIIGAVNWGLMGFFGFNLVAAIFGEVTGLTRIVYALVGLSGLYELYNVTIGYNAMHSRWCSITPRHVPIRH